ncbi:hypothetical protein D3C81_1807270 [compost metagenome]
MNSTVAFRSSMRAMLIDLPWLRVSSWASSSAWASTRLVNVCRMRSRSAGRRPDQTRDLKAAWADSTARFMYSSGTFGTSAMVSPVAGLNTGVVGPSGSTHWPSIKQPWRRARNAATCGRISTLLMCVPLIPRAET